MRLACRFWDGYNPYARDFTGKYDKNPSTDQQKFMKYFNVFVQMW